MPIPALEALIKKAADGTSERTPIGTPNVSMGIKPLKLFVRPYWLSAPTEELAANAQSIFRYKIDSQGHFDWMAILGVFEAGPVMLEFNDANSNRLLQNKPVHSTTVVGSGRRYFRLAAPYFFNVGDSQREFQIRVINVLGAGTQDVNLTLFGRRFYHKEMPPEMALELSRKLGEGLKKYAYFLVPVEYDHGGIPPAVTANGKASFTFSLDDSADMEITKLMLASTGAFSFRLWERDKNKDLMSGEVHSLSGWGNAEFPFPMADSFLLQRKRQLILDVVDLSGAENTIFATMHGNRLQYR